MDEQELKQRIDEKISEFEHEEDHDELEKIDAEIKDLIRQLKEIQNG